MGRPITGEDSANTRPVAVVNQAFAKKFFGNENPIGQQFGLAAQRNAGMYEIVGVASDIDFIGGVQPVYFLPEAQTTHFNETETENREIWSHYLYNIVIWAPGKPPDLGVQVRKALADVDPNLVVYDVQPYSEVIHADFSRQNMIAKLASLFGVVALVLAAVGVYGLTAYGVEQRMAEIGVRVALGADGGSVVAMILQGAFRQVGIGLVFGIPAAISVGYMIASQLFGVKPWDPLLLSGAALMLVLAALIAAFIPARHAARADPVQALRAD